MKKEAVEYEELTLWLGQRGVKDKATLPRATVVKEKS